MSLLSLDQFNASLLNESINFLGGKTFKQSCIKEYNVWTDEAIHLRIDSDKSVC